MHPIETKNLQLIPASARLLRAVLKGDKQIANMLDIQVANNWTVFGLEVFQYVLEKIDSETRPQLWWTYFPILKSEQKLIGSGGYKGPPKDGMVEIGYEIAAEYHNQGFATEMAKGLVERAFEEEQVQVIWAHTLGEENASTKVLQKIGFEKLEALHDPEDGLIWKWVLNKNSID